MPLTAFFQLVEYEKSRRLRLHVQKVAEIQVGIRIYLEHLQLAALLNVYGL